MKHRQAYVNDMGEAEQSFTAGSSDAIPLCH
jgi:hypothetical protein